MSSDPQVPKLQRYCIKADALSAEKVWDFVQANGLTIYERGHTQRSARKYQYEVYMYETDFLAFKLTHHEIKIFHMAEKEAVEDLMVTHYIEVPQDDTHKELWKIRKLLGQTSVIDLSKRMHSPGKVGIKVIVTDGSEEENILKLTYGHMMVK
jgi:hypothetical protein